MRGKLSVVVVSGIVASTFLILASCSAEVVRIAGNNTANQPRVTNLASADYNTTSTISFSDATHTNDLTLAYESGDRLALTNGTLRLDVLPDDPSPVYGLTADGDGNVMRGDAPLTSATIPFGSPTAEVNGTATTGSGGLVMDSGSAPALANPFTPALAPQEFVGNGTDPVLQTAQSTGPAGALPHLALASGKTNAPAGGYTAVIKVPNQSTITTISNFSFPLLTAGDYTFAVLEADQIFTGDNTFDAAANTSLWSPLISFTGGTAYGIAFDGDVGQDGNVVYLVPPTLPTGIREIAVPDADGVMAVSATAPIALDANGNISYTAPTDPSFDSVTTTDDVWTALPAHPGALVIDFGGGVVTGAYQSDVGVVVQDGAQLGWVPVNFLPGTVINGLGWTLCDYTDREDYTVRLQRMDTTSSSGCSWDDVVTSTASSNTTGAYGYQTAVSSHTIADGYVYRVIVSPDGTPSIPATIVAIQFRTSSRQY